MSKFVVRYSLVLTAASILFSACSLRQTSAPSPAPTNEISSPAPTESPATSPSATPVATSKLAYICKKGETAFSALFVSGNTAKFTESSLGKLITEINGQPQTDGKYWLYSIDGKDATVGAEAYQCKGAEKILWELK